MRDGAKPERSPVCALDTGVDWFFGDTKSRALRCADDLDALAAWHEGHFNWRDACWICF